MSVGAAMQCSSDATSRIELCSTSDGSQTGPSIDASESGATKFHVGGVLKVKVSEEGVAIYGHTNFSGAATFFSDVTVHGATTFHGTTTFNGQPTFNDDGNYNNHNHYNSGSESKFYGGSLLQVQSGAELQVQDGAALNVQSNGVLDIAANAQMEVQANGAINLKQDGYLRVESGGYIDLEPGAQPLWMAPSWGTADSCSTTGQQTTSSLSMNALSGKITGCVVLDSDNRDEVTWYNSYIGEHSFVIATATSCGTARPLFASVNVVSAGVAVVRVETRPACSEAWEISFAVFDTNGPDSRRRRRSLR